MSLFPWLDELKNDASAYASDLLGVDINASTKTPTQPETVPDQTAAVPDTKLPAVETAGNLFETYKMPIIAGGVGLVVLVLLLKGRD